MHLQKKSVKKNITPYCTSVRVSFIAIFPGVGLCTGNQDFQAIASIYWAVFDLGAEFKINYTLSPYSSLSPYMSVGIAGCLVGFCSHSHGPSLTISGGKHYETFFAELGFSFHNGIDEAEKDLSPIFLFGWDL